MSKKAQRPAPSWRLKQLRSARGMTLEQLAMGTGLTRSYVSKLERGVATPSIATAMGLAKALAVEIGDLFGAEAESDDYAVIRKSGRKDYERMGQTVQAIAPLIRHAQFRIFVIRPRLKTPRGVAHVHHAGQELLFVLKGRVELGFPSKSVHLDEGDAIVFRGHVPHRLRSLGSDRAEALVVITDDGENAKY